MACADIRDNIRSNINESRQLQRDKVFGSRRKALQDYVNVGRDVTQAEVVLIANKLKSKSTVQVEDLALLKLSFVQDSRNIIAFLKNKGALHSLVRELSSTKSNYQLVAAECCCNLALGDARSCWVVAKAAGPYLIPLLSGLNYNLTSISVWALGNLVGSDEKTWNIIHAQGFLGKLLPLIVEQDKISDSPASVDIKQNAFTALTQFLRFGLKHLTPEEIESIIKTVVSLNNTSIKGVRVSEFLLSCYQGAEQLMIENKVHIKCLQFLESTELTDETVSSITPALRTVANLVAEPTGMCCLDILTNWPLLQETIQKIFSSSYSHLVSEIGWLLGNLSNHQSPEVQTAMEEFSSYFQLYVSQYTFFNR